MKKILLISYHFAPNNTIGSVRPTKIAKYLSYYGYDVTVVSAEAENITDEKMKIDTKEINEIITVRHSKFYKIYLKYYSLLRGNIRRGKPGLSSSNIKHSEQIDKSIKKVSMLTEIKKNIAGLKSLLRDYDFYKKAIYYMKKNKIELSSYDAVFSTYNIMGNHLIAKFIKGKYPNINWIADYRDPIITPNKKNTLKTYFYIKNNNGILKSCDHIVAVSKGYLDMITDGNYLNKSHVIYNGYDPEELVAVSEEIDDKVFRFVYTGGLYGGQRNLSPLFEAVSYLVKSDTIKKERVEFIYAGKDRRYFESLGEYYDFSDNITAYDFITRSDALKLQYKSDFLIVATWNYLDYFGVLPGKLFEYMNANKKIIALVEGNKKNSEIKHIIKQSNIGFCYENINKSEDFELLCKFIEDAYNMKFNLKVKSINKNMSELKKFSYEYITKQFIDLINK